MDEINHNILYQPSLGDKKLALLLDPEKADLNALPLSSDSHPDFIFVGGSTGGDTTPFVRALREKLSIVNCQLSIILFPGSAAQFTPEADAILYLSLLSGDNPEYLVSQQIKSARRIHASSVEVIPTAYILIDGGVETSTMRVTGTKPLNPSNAEGIQTIVDTSIAAELMGKQAIYLEAGSGAKTPVSLDIIREVRKNTSVTLIVGGGIRTPEAMQAAYSAGADIVVIGNHFESHPEDLNSFLTVLQSSGLMTRASCVLLCKRHTRRRTLKRFPLAASSSRITESSDADTTSPRHSLTSRLTRRYRPSRRLHRHSEENTSPMQPSTSQSNHALCVPELSGGRK